VDPITAVAPAAGALDNFPRRLAFIPLAVGVVLLMIAMYRNRGNFAKVSMSEFYAWSSELRAGGNPWQASGDPAFKPLPGVLHLGHCNYPPAFLMAFEPLTMLPVRAAYWLWQGIILACLLAATLIVAHDLGPPADAAPYALAAGAALLFPETYGTFYESQLTFILLLLLVVSYACDRRGRSIAAGLTLALAMLFKMFPGLAAGYFLLRRRWATLAWAIVFGVLGMVLTGARSQYAFMQSGVLHSSWLADDAWLRNDRSIAVYSNLRALLDWLSGGSLPEPLIPLWLGLTALACVLTVAITAAATRRPARSAEGEVASYGLWLTAAIIVSPISWGHYLPLILPLLFGLAVDAIRCPRKSTIARLLVVTGLIALYAAYFAGALRQRHILFVATVLIFAGSAWLVGQSRKSSEARVSL